MKTLFRANVKKEGKTGDELEPFLKMLGRSKSLTREEEQALFKRYAKGDRKALDVIVRKNMPLVITLARKLAYKNQVPVEDLLQEGGLALMRAAELFQPRKGYRFCTYATHWVHAFVTRYVQQNKTSVRAPTTWKHGSSRFLASDFSLDASLSDEEDISFKDRLVDLSPGLDEEFEREERDTEVKEALTRLAQRLGPMKMDIVEKRLKRDGPDKVTLDELGVRWGVSRERVRQLEKQTLNIVGHYFTEQGVEA